MSKKEQTAAPVETGLVDTVDALVAKMQEVREAQRIFATYTQEQVDKIFFAAAMAANKQRIPPKWRWRKPAWASSRTR